MRDTWWLSFSNSTGGCMGESGGSLCVRSWVCTCVRGRQSISLLYLRTKLYCSVSDRAAGILLPVSFLPTLDAILKKVSLWRFAGRDNVRVSAWWWGPLVVTGPSNFAPPFTWLCIFHLYIVRKSKCVQKGWNCKKQQQQQCVSWILNARENNWKTNKTNRIMVKLVLPAIGRDCRWSVVQL